MLTAFGRIPFGRLNSERMSWMSGELLMKLQEKERREMMMMREIKGGKLHESAIILEGVVAHSQDRDVQVF